MSRVRKFSVQSVFGLSAAWGAVLLLVGCTPDFETVANEALSRETSEWSSYGGEGGRKYADLDQITKANVGDLELAWSYRHGEVDTVFQATPVLIEGRLVFCSPWR